MSAVLLDFGIGNVAYRRRANSWQVELRKYAIEGREPEALWVISSTTWRKIVAAVKAAQQAELPL